MYPQNTCLESDWKLFRKRVPVWQERYMGRLMEEYRAILESEESSSEKFWALEKRIRQDKKAPGVTFVFSINAQELEHTITLLGIVMDRTLMLDVIWIDFLI